MSAETLRRAAALMRERARAGEPLEFPSPWSIAVDDPDLETYEVLCHEDGSGLVTDDLDRDIAEHIASWHPAVALAVADWLEGVAAWQDEGLGDTARLGRTNWPSMWGDVQTAAAAVARAYLGESA